MSEENPSEMDTLTFIRLKPPNPTQNPIPTIEVMMSEINGPYDVNDLLQISEMMYSRLEEKQYITNETIVIFSYVRHAFRSTRNIVICYGDDDGGIKPEIKEKIDLLNTNSIEGHRMIQEYLDQSYQYASSPSFKNKLPQDQFELHLFTIYMETLRVETGTAWGPIEAEKFKELQNLYPQSHKNSQ